MKGLLFLILIFFLIFSIEATKIKPKKDSQNKKQGEQSIDVIIDGKNQKIAASELLEKQKKFEEIKKGEIVVEETLSASELAQKNPHINSIVEFVKSVLEILKKNQIIPPNTTLKSLQSNRQEERDSSTQLLSLETSQGMFELEVQKKDSSFKFWKRLSNAERKLLFEQDGKELNENRKSSLRALLKIMNYMEGYEFNYIFVGFLLLITGISLIYCSKSKQKIKKN